MKVTDLIIANNVEYTDALFKTAKKVPADKLDWKPEGGNGQSVLSMCAECAMSPGWPLAVLQSTGKFDITPEMMEIHRAEKAALTTLEACEAKAKENVGKLNAFIAAYPEGDLQKPVELVFRPDPMPAAECMQIHMWNAIYHTGQVNYIQTLYGDKSMS